jgi:hypothetical protein
MVEAASTPVGELEAQPEAAVGERRAVDREPEHPLARRLLPAELRGVLRGRGEQQAGLVAELEGDAATRSRIVIGSPASSWSRSSPSGPSSRASTIRASPLPYSRRPAVLSAGSRSSASSLW